MNRLKELRKSRNLTVRELEDKTKISYSMISRLETGNCMLNEQHLNILADFFNVTTDYILGKTDIAERIHKKPLLNNPKFDRIFFLISLLSETEFELIETVIENILTKKNIKYEEIYKNKKVM